MTQLSGAYFVVFESNLGSKGVGTIIVNGHRISGGDGGYIYRGYVTNVGGCYFGKIAVIRVDPDAVSIFGATERFEIEVSGWSSGKEIKFSGWVAGWEHLRLRFTLKHAMSIAAE